MTTTLNTPTAPRVREQLLALADRYGALIDEVTDCVRQAGALEDAGVAEEIVHHFRTLDPEYARVLARLLMASRLDRSRTAIALNDLFVCMERNR